MRQNLVKALGEYSGAFFVRHQSCWSRVQESDAKSALKQPVELWFQGGELSKEAAACLKRVLKRVPKVTTIRFLGTKVTDAAREQLRKACPNASIERASVHNRTTEEELAARYQERRTEFEKRFESYRPVSESRTAERSPSGRYELTKTAYTAGPSTWGYSRGIVVDTASGNEIADIRRNYGAFWHAWIVHSNGNEYLLCGEDYQGQTVVNLSQGTARTYFPEAGYNGAGFCWAQVFPSPDGLMLAVEGCYWAGPYDLVFYDFRTPEDLPFIELNRIDGLSDAKGWKDNDTFILTREIQVRRSDGAPYDSLSEEEQDRLDSDDTLTEYKTEQMAARRPILDHGDANKHIDDDAG